MEEKKKLICTRCGVEMEMRNTNFSYLGHGFHAETLRCPSCGQVYLPEELVRGKIAEVEFSLEDK